MLATTKVQSTTKAAITELTTAAASQIVSKNFLLYFEQSIYFSIQFQVSFETDFEILCSCLCFNYCQCSRGLNCVLQKVNNESNFTPIRLPSNIVTALPLSSLSLIAGFHDYTACGK